MSSLDRYVAEPEILEPTLTGFVDVLVLADPFTFKRTKYRVAAGLTVQEIVERVGLAEWKGALVSIDGHAIPEDWWSRVRPRMGHLIAIRAIPRGGGDNEEKSWGQIILGIVVIIVGIVLAVYGFGAGTPLIMMGVSMVIGGAIGLLFPPPQPPKLKDTSGSDNAVFSITGSRNTANPYGVVPRVYGRHLIFPNFAALPYTELAGNDQYLREVFTLGYGPLELSELKIGETPIQNFTGFEYEVRNATVLDDPGHSDLSDNPLGLFTNDIVEDALQIHLLQNVIEVRRTRENVDEISVDITWPRGIFRFQDSDYIIGDADAAVFYRNILSSDPAILAEHIALSGVLEKDMVRRTVHWSVPAGQYDVYVVTSVQEYIQGTGPLAGANEAWWTALRSIKNEDPITLPGIVKVAIRVKATDQLNGVIDTFNCVAQSILPAWNGAAWVSAPTSQPAAIYRDILQGTANARPVADSRLDLPALQAWAGETDAAGRTFSFVVEQPTTIFELLRQVTAVGRATFGSVDGTLGVVREVAQSVPVQHFTPRNSRDFRATKLFRDIPHGLKVRFINPDSNWQTDEVIVYDDGYNAANATKFEAIQFFGVTDPDQAWKLGRYHIAAARLRPEVYEFTTDIEHLVCTRGDLIRLNHDVPLFGIKPARVKTVTTDGGGNATAITVDELMPMEAGKSYGLRIRKSTGASIPANIVTVAGEQSSLTFTAPIAPASIPVIGDLILFGEAAEDSVECIVTKIEMQRDLGARISCVDAAPAIHQADTGAIPPFDPHITQPATIVRVPPLVNVISVQSNEEVLARAQDGSFESRIVIAIGFQSATGLPPESIQIQFKRTDGVGAWTSLPPVPAATRSLEVRPVEDGATYDVRLRSENSGAVSEWTTLTHTVIGKTTPPPDVGTFLVEAGTLRWAYPTPPRDLAGFVIRRHFGDRRSWDDAQTIASIGGGGTSYTLPILDVGTVTYLIKAIDVAGNESITPAALVLNLGDPVVTNLIDTTDYKAAGFPGTVTNGTVSGGNLVADSGAMFWNDAEGDGPFWEPTDAIQFWPDESVEMVYVFSALPDADKVPCALILDTTVTATSWWLQYRLSGPELFWVAPDAGTFWETT